MGCRHSSVDSSVPTILPPRVWVPSHTIYTFIIHSQICTLYCHVKRMKINNRGRVWPIGDEQLDRPIVKHVWNDASCDKKVFWRNRFPAHPRLWTLWLRRSTRSRRWCRCPRRWRRCLRRSHCRHVLTSFRRSNLTSPAMWRWRQLTKGLERIEQKLKFFN